MAMAVAVATIHSWFLTSCVHILSVEFQRLTFRFQLSVIRFLFVCAFSVFHVCFYSCLLPLLYLFPSVSISISISVSFSVSVSSSLSCSRFHLSFCRGFRFCFCFRYSFFFLPPSAGNTRLKIWGCECGGKNEGLRLWGCKFATRVEWAWAWNGTVACFS